MPELRQFCMVAETAMRARYDLSQPFSRGAYSYATNGQILVRVPRVCEDAEAAWPKIEALASMITHASLSPLPKLDVEDAAECPTCKGYGVVRPHMTFGYYCEGCKRCTWGYIPARKPHPDQETCDTCEGRKVTWPEGATVMLTPRCAIAPRYYRMIAELPNPRVDLTVDAAVEPASPVSFAFDGGDGLVMPMRIRGAQVQAA